MDNEFDYYIQIIEEIDSIDRDVTEWEASFVESMLEQREEKGYFIITDKQKLVIDKMKEKYLV